MKRNPALLLRMNPYIEKDDYSGLPEELLPFNYYVPDTGRSIFAVIGEFLDKAITNEEYGVEGYMVALPVRYVLAKGYKMYEEYPVVDVPYNSELGALVSEQFYDYARG